MYRLYAIFGLGVLLWACNPKVSDSAQASAEAAVESAGQMGSFPDAWVGTWVGALDIYRGTKKLQSVPMEIQIGANDGRGRYSWTSTFLGKDTIVKPYELQTIDAAAGKYVMDEKNSIKIESYLHDQKLVSWFEVQGSLISATYEIINGQLVFEILAGSDKEVSTTGGTQFEGEDIPPVRSFPIGTMQRGVLTKKN
ncbi:MAG: hypothetical protein AAFV95_13615 [Bacteroidota bacterium]